MAATYERPVAAGQDRKLRDTDSSRFKQVSVAIHRMTTGSALCHLGVRSVGDGRVRDVLLHRWVIPCEPGSPASRSATVAAIRAIVQLAHDEHLEHLLAEPPEPPQGATGAGC